MITVQMVVENLVELPFEVVGAVDNGKSLVETALKLQADVTIADTSMPILSGIEAAGD